ncbi:DUF6285 domain-containing protein [Mycobacterium sp. 1274756.6]|uniref:DUF6285 domain-containing protein n=1 Tax=Mycobacterium sp. 1274756.6 TaxID=1834076 RepID=UPI0007FD3F55|nr:DUF6285 domain-containing protein [Mycobacterium sp. 1274756.6]OBJ73188.1 hypothetical protein A5643_00420 [Mycobacterium sp. 1274756.6]
MSAGLYGRPTAAELVAAATEFLDGLVAGGATDATGGAARFQARVAANALRIVHRELEHGAAGAARAQAALDAIGYPDEAALAAAIRAGDLDGRDASDAQVTACLRALVAERLAVAHPGYDRSSP